MLTLIFTWLDCYVTISVQYGKLLAYWMESRNEYVMSISLVNDWISHVSMLSPHPHALSYSWQLLA